MILVFALFLSGLNIVSVQDSNTLKPKYDLFVTVENSAHVSDRDFEMQKNVINMVYTSVDTENPENRVSVIRSSFSPDTIFHIDDPNAKNWDTRNEFLKNLKKNGGKNCIAKTLDVVASEIIKAEYQDSTRPKVALVFLQSWEECCDEADTIEKAHYLMHLNVLIIAVGVGHEIDAEKLSLLSGYSVRTDMYSEYTSFLANPSLLMSKITSMVERMSLPESMKQNGFTNPEMPEMIPDSHNIPGAISPEVDDGHLSPEMPIQPIEVPHNVPEKSTEANDPYHIPGAIHPDYNDEHQIPEKIADDSNPHTIPDSVADASNVPSSNSGMYSNTLEEIKKLKELVEMDKLIKNAFDSTNGDTKDKPDTVTCGNNRVQSVGCLPIKASSQCYPIRVKISITEPEGGSATNFRTPVCNCADQAVKSGLTSFVMLPTDGCGMSLSRKRSEVFRKFEYAKCAQGFTKICAADSVQVYNVTNSN